MKKKCPVITIDGASGTGKGVVTHIIAKQLGWNLLDSGALYRVLALAAKKKDIPANDEVSLTSLAHQLDVQFISSEIGMPPRIMLNEEEVTETIRSEEIGNMASKVGAIPAVRIALLNRQRAFRKPPGLVTDGRDMGTVVFPDADLKVFLTASPEVRARRRFNQLKEMGIRVNLGDLVGVQKERDQRDRERAVSPLKPAEDAICVETDSLTIEEVVTRVMQEIKKIFA